MKVRRVDFSPDEYLSGVAGMPPEDQGVYWLICALIYSTGGPIQDDDERLISLSGCHGNRRNAIIDRLAQRGKIVRKGSEIDQKRSRKELENAQKRSENASENVAKRWNNRHLEDNVVMLGRNANHQPSTISSKENLNQGVEAKESRSRKTQVPPDWRPTDDGARYATDHGLTDSTTNAEIEKFRDFHRSKANTFADHNAAWRTWVRNVRPQKPNGRSNEPLTNERWKLMSDEERAEYLPGYIRPY
jgi:uncharacterized protein YdaU (DUF1376 family)